MVRNLILLRATQRISASEIARRAGISVPTVTRTELGETNPTLETRKRIACALGVDALWLFEESEPEGSHED